MSAVVHITDLPLSPKLLAKLLPDLSEFYPLSEERNPVWKKPANFSIPCDSGELDGRGM